MKMKELGELAFIDRLARRVGTSPRVRLGIGDDSAVLEAVPGRHLLATCDMLVEGVHFDLSFSSAAELGEKSLVASLSDIAAMGGRPLYALVSLGVRPDIDASFGEEMFRSLVSTAARYGVDVVGGDTVSAPHGMVVDVTVIGDVDAGGYVSRAGAVPGDVIMVTGSLGDSAAGLALLKTAHREGPESLTALKTGVTPLLPGQDALFLLQRHLRPVPRLTEARFLTANGRPSAMIDVSDGLAAEIHHLCRAGGTGARIRVDRLPLSPQAREAARRLGCDPLDWVFHGGEDYELLFTVPPAAAAYLAESFTRTTGTALTVIGEVTPPADGVTAVLSGGECIPLARGGYEHFRPR